MISIAIILAGGSGLRMNSDLPKQFMLLAGKPVIKYSIDAFQNSGLFEHIIIVCHPDYFNRIPDLSETHCKQHVISGGESRNESTEKAIHYIREIINNKDKEIKLLFHDAARPNISKETIIKLHHALSENKVAVAVSKINDTIYETDSDGNFSKIKNRDFFVKAQTPQAFRLSVIENAYQLKKQDGNPDFTDDISIIKAYIPQQKIYFISDNPWNIKLTNPEDICVMEALLAKNEIN